MITTRTELVEKEITTYACDFCDYSIEHNKGYCGVAPIQECHFCGKHLCRECRTEEWENDDSYSAEMRACPDCKERALEAWEIARDFAGRHDRMYDVVQNVFKNLEEYKNDLE